MKVTVVFISAVNTLVTSFKYRALSGSQCYRWERLPPRPSDCWQTGYKEAAVMNRALSVSQEAWMSISPACSVSTGLFMHHGGESAV